MIHIEGETVIRRRVEEVFDYASDECNEPRYNAGMLGTEKLSTGPIGVGTQFQAEARTKDGTAKMTIEITAFERPLRVSSSTYLPSMDIQGTLTF